MKSITPLIIGLGALFLLGSRSQQVTPTEAATAVSKSNEVVVQNYVSQQQAQGVNNADIINSITNQFGAAGSNGMFINGVFTPAGNTIQENTAAIVNNIIDPSTGTAVQLSSASLSDLKNKIQNALNNPFAFNQYAGQSYIGNIEITERDIYGGDVTASLLDWKQGLGL